MASASPAIARRPRKVSRVWWHVHQWVGFKLALFMSFICLTGSLAVLSHEIDWLLQPALRVSPSTVAAGEPNWTPIVKNATRYPRVKEVMSVAEPIAGAFAVRAIVRWKDGSWGFLYLHPTTGAIQGEGPWVGAERILRNMHRHLNLPVWIGVPIVGSLGFLLLISFVTSLVVYKKWWRGFLKAPRKRDARTWWGDFHRLAGVWSLWFVALIGLTGVWYFVEQLGADANVPQFKHAAPFADNLSIMGDRFAANLAAARAADPALKIENIRLPTKKAGAFVFEGAQSAILIRPRANAVWTDVATGQVLATYDGRDLTVHQRISEMADPLHFGTFGGYWTKVPWFAFGMLLTMLSVSGMAVYALRIGRELKRATPFRVARSVVWVGMGRWRWLATTFIATAFLMMWTLFDPGAN